MDEFHNERTLPSMKSILIFGAGGFTGGQLVLAAGSAGWQVTAASRNPVNAPGQAQVDITDGHAVSQLIQEIRPDVVVNTAAMARIDQAEQNQALAYQVNTTAAVHIARLCAEIGAKTIFFSSDTVVNRH